MNSGELFCHYFIVFVLLLATDSASGLKFTLNDDNIFSFTNTKGVLLSGDIDTIGSKSIKTFDDCSAEGGTEFCKISKGLFKLLVNVEFKIYDEDKTKCHSLRIQTFSKDYNPKVCLELVGANWYGAAELHTQRWPLSRVTLPLQPFVTNDIVPANVSFGNVIERYWMNSKGVAILIDERTPLFSSFNATGDGQVCFQAKFEHPFNNVDKILPELGIEICEADNIKAVHEFISKHRFSRSSGTPDVRMFKSPIWSTWARYKVNINQKKVLEYADEIIQHGFSNSQIEIDDMFSTYYGELDFTRDKFPDPVKMVSELKQKGFRTTVWVTPFANLDSPAFKTGMENSYWLMDKRRQVPALLKWWQGVGAILDVSNPDAVDWFVKRLQEMRETYGIDSFKFDAGEVSYLPYSYAPTTSWENPSTFTKLYVEAVSRLGDMIEVRCGYKSQNHPVFVRMGDKESRWGYDNGLKTIIPTTLTFGILGYPFILPDMIGGNAYTYEGDNIELTKTVLPDRELYIRWLQVTAYLPAMQFSIVPWQYDNEVVELAREYVRIHEEIVTPILLEAASEYNATGTPLIRPLWWLEPDVEAALECDDQFLVGNALMVAPVLEQGARARDIYLPEGSWEDVINHVTLKGGRWLWKYKADLHECPTFRKLH